MLFADAATWIRASHNTGLQDGRTTVMHGVDSFQPKQWICITTHQLSPDSWSVTDCSLLPRRTRVNWLWRSTLETEWTLTANRCLVTLTSLHATQTRTRSPVPLVLLQWWRAWMPALPDSSTTHRYRKQVSTSTAPTQNESLSKKRPDTDSEKTSEPRWTIASSRSLTPQRNDSLTADSVSFPDQPNRPAGIAVSWFIALKEPNCSKQTLCSFMLNSSINHPTLRK